MVWRAPTGEFPPTFSLRRASGSSSRRRVADAVISRAVVLDDVKLDSIKHRVITDRSRVSGTFTERLSIRFPRSAHVITADRVERDQFDGVDLNVDVADRIDAANSNLWPLPKAKGDGDAACDYLGAQLPAELHCLGDNKTSRARPLRRLAAP